MCIRQARSSPRWTSNRPARPAPISDDPTCTRPLVAPLLFALCSAWPSAPDLTVSIGIRTRTTTSPKGMHNAHDGPWTLDPRTSIVLAHSPVRDPRFRISTRAAPQRLTAPRHQLEPLHLFAQQHSSAPPCTSLRLCNSSLGVEPTGSTHSPNRQVYSFATTIDSMLEANSARPPRLVRFCL